MNKKDGDIVRKRSAGSIVSKIILVVAVLVLIGSLSYLFLYFYTSAQQKRFDDETAETYFLPVQAEEREEEEGKEEDADESPFYVDFDALLAQSKYVIGWIRVPALQGLSYPIVQYTDNDYFLHRSWDCQSQYSGSIFIDAACSGDFSDPHTIIYGHNMKNGTMFGLLQRYKDESFYEENGGVIMIYLPEETRTYEIFSVEVVDQSDPNVYTVGFIHDDTFGNFVSGMKSRSLYKTDYDVADYDDVITLSTCTSVSTNRLTVHAKLVSSIPVYQ